MTKKKKREERREKREERREKRKREEERRREKKKKRRRRVQKKREVSNALVVLSVTLLPALDGVMLDVSNSSPYFHSHQQHFSVDRLS